MKKRENFGLELVLDLFDCDPKIISSAEKLRAYVARLCKLIGMKPYGKTMTPYFGTSADFTKGYSLLQFIETSSITGHFSELWNTAYINIFSCKTFDAAKAKNFTKEFFKAKKIKSHLLIRK